MKKETINTNNEINTGEFIYNKLKEEITAGSLDSSIYITEVLIANRYDVSRTPVREALRRLESEYFLEYASRKGYKVRSLKTQDIIFLYESCIAMEGMTAYLAAKRYNSDSIKKLKEIASREMSYLTDISEENLREHNRLNFDFHMLIAEMAANPYLYKALLTVHENLLVLSPYSVLHMDYQQGASHWLPTSHQRICEAIEYKDADLAEYLMRKHFMVVRDKYLKLINK